MSQPALAARPTPSDEPTAVLRAEHEAILRACTLLERLAARIEAGGNVDAHHLARLKDFIVSFADKTHHGKEEDCLFPALERAGLPRHGGPVACMLEEHEQGRHHVRAIGAPTAPGTPRAMRDFARLLRGHIDKENHILFSMAEELLSPDAKDTLRAAFRESDIRVARELGRSQAVYLGELEALEREAEAR